MTCSVAMAPPAPGRLSMTNCCPSGPPIAVAKVRPIRSAAPPAELGMTSLIGFAGQSAAPAGPLARSSAKSAALGLMSGIRLCSAHRVLYIAAMPAIRRRAYRHDNQDVLMSKTIRLQSDSNAHDRPWRVAVEQGFFADEGLTVEYNEDNPKGVAGRVENFSERWKESQLKSGALEVYPVCEWGAIERVQALGKGKIIGLDTTVRTGALMVRKDSAIQSVAELRNVPIAVTWHAGTFYAAIEVLEAAGVPFDEIKLVHANDRLDALLSGKTQAAALMEPLVSRAAAAGCRRIADLRWRGGIVASDDVDAETPQKITRALNRAIQWLRDNDDRARQEVLRDLTPEQRRGGLMPELIGVQDYQPAEFQEKVDWMMDRGFLREAPAYAEIVRGGEGTRGG